MTQIREFVFNNFRTLFLAVSFVVTMYIQHITNTTKISELSDKCKVLDLKLQDQYEKIDAIKLDKAVFEATMSQFTSMRTDLREMRADIKELLKSIH